jgi:hypothetical protein
MAIYPLFFNPGASLILKIEKPFVPHSSFTKTINQKEVLDMNEKNGVKVIEVLSSKGEPVFLFKIREGTLNTLDDEEGNAPRNALSKAGNDASKDDPMSYAQKRYIFRLLAEQGLDGNEAHEHLKKQCNVDSLKEITKAEASQEIERILREAKGVENHGSLK